MNVIDLTVPIPNLQPEKQWPDQQPVDKVTTKTRHWHIQGRGMSYTAAVHFFDFWSMSGTYLDLPAHVVDTDDGVDAVSVSPDRLYRVPSDIVRPEPPEAPGAVTAEALTRATAAAEPLPGLVLNALGDRRFDQVPERSVYLRTDAVEWMVKRGVRLLVSDVYESDTNPQNVFPTLFRAGVIAVCCPQCLGCLGEARRARITALPLCVPRATQAPCRLLAELENAPRGTAQRPHGTARPE